MNYTLVPNWLWLGELRMALDGKPLEVSETLMTRLSILTFSCERKTVHVNKDVLLKSCPNFQGLVSGSFRESRQNTIELEQIPYHAFNCLAQFLNTGILDVEKWTLSFWKSTIIFAHEYQCEEFLEKLVEELSPIEKCCKDILEITHVAQELEIKGLLEKCWSALDLLSSHVMADRSLFSELPESIVLELVARDTFYVDEHKLLKAVIAWLEVHPAADPKSLLAKIRWEQINVKLLGKAAPFKAMFADLAPKHRRVLQPFTWKQACLPNTNIAPLFLPPDSKLLANGHYIEDHFDFGGDVWRTLIKFPRPFRLNTIRFKLFGQEKHNFKLTVYLNGKVNHVVERRGSSWQEICFKDQLVDQVDMYTNTNTLWLNSFECMTIAKVFGTDSLAHKNMVAAPDFPFGGSSSQLDEDTIDFTLKQSCFVETVALYLDQFEKKWGVGLADQEGTRLVVIKLDEVQLGHFIVLVFHIERSCIIGINITGRDVLANLTHVECPARLTRLAGPGVKIKSIIDHELRRQDFIDDLTEVFNAGKDDYEDMFGELDDEEIDAFLY